MTVKPIFFFDCDNCLYSKDLKVNVLMKEKIREYFVEVVGVPEEEVVEIQNKYHSEYGLSLRGLTKHHSVDPIHFELKHMLRGLNCRKWVFANAYKVHALRCLTLLGIENEFDGLTYTNYLKPDFNCKPEPESFLRAMEDAGVTDPSLVYFVDDSALNIDAAQKLGWTTVHVADDASKSNHGDYQINDIHELPQVLPELWEHRHHKMKFRRASISITTAA
ncbi:unnamed protein product [Mucor hiemalis]